MPYLNPVNIAILTAQWHAQFTNQLAEQCEKYITSYTDNLKRYAKNRRIKWNTEEVFKAPYCHDLKESQKVLKLIDLLDYLGRVKVQLIKVPGSAELPITASWVAQTIKPKAVICIGALIKGETDHYHYIAQQVGYALQKVALQHNTAIINGVLTCHNNQQVADRLNGNHSKCGEDWAKAALDMVVTKYNLYNATNYCLSDITKEISDNI